MFLLTSLSVRVKHRDGNPACKNPAPAISTGLPRNTFVSK